MNKLMKISFFFILLFTSCKDTTIEKNANSKSKEVAENTSEIDTKREKLKIDTLINNKKLSFYHYLKVVEETEFIEYTGDESVYEQFEVDCEYQVYYENSKLVALKEIDQWGGEGHSSTTYYYNENGSLFCYDYYSINASEGDAEQWATIYLDKNIKISNESYKRKTSIDITYNKIDFVETPVFYKTVSEIMKAFELDDCQKKIYKTNSSESNNQFISQIDNEGLMSLRDIQLALIDGSLKKSKILLNEPSKYELGFGHVSKGFAVYYNKVSNPNGNPKHLVLFLRMNGNKWGNDAEIEDIYAIDDNQKACFGIHCIKIKNQTIYTNALDLIYDKGYKSIN